MKSPTISVIMATYNHADFVAQAIDSVLNQYGIDFEFLIADDGSTDNTREVVSSVNDERIRFIPNEINRGACTVTNELIQRASGEFIALINSDDCWVDDDKLAYQLEIMRQNKTVGACFGRAKFIDKHGQTINKTTLQFGTVFDQENRSQGRWLRHFFDHGNCICHPTMLIRKSCYGDLGLYNNRYRQLPDLDMWIRLAKRYDIYVSERELVNFRVIPGENASSQTTTNSIRTINEHFLIAESFFDGIKREHLIDGFEDLLIHKDVSTDVHLNIERNLLYFNYNQWLGKPYKMIGLLNMYKLLNDPIHYNVLVKSYGIDDKWFQQQMGEIDVLRPKISAALSQSKSIFNGGWNRILSRLIRN